MKTTTLSMAAAALIASSANAATLGSTSFEIPPVAPQTNSNAGFGTGPGQTFVASGGELGFTTSFSNPRFSNTGPVDGAESGDFIGVTDLTGQFGAFTDGTKGYVWNDTDGTVTLTLDPINTAGITTLRLTFDQFANNSININTYEGADAFSVEVNGDEVFSQSADQLETLADTNAWSTVSLDLSAYGGQVITIGFNGDTSAGSETLYIDNVVVTGDDVAPPPIVTLAAQDFNDLPDDQTLNEDTVADGDPLTNGGSFNSGGPGLGFQTFWSDTRGIGGGPVSPTGDTVDDIGVNSDDFASTDPSPNEAADGTPVGSGTEHNFKFNDGDGRLDLVFDPVDTTGFEDLSVSLDYWITGTGFETGDAFMIKLIDENDAEQILLDISEAGLEAAGFENVGDADEWINLSSAITLTGSQITLIVSSDSSAQSENMFVDNILFSGRQTLNPIPSPTGLAFGIGGLTLLAGRRHRVSPKVSSKP